jgi:hypothetical protein
MKKLKNIGESLSRNEMKTILGSISELKSWKCCSNTDGHCGTCASSSGIPTCSTGYTLQSC